jgi:hypothetical protein
LRFGFRQVLINVALRVNDRGLAFGADEVRGVRETSEVELLEVHFLKTPVERGVRVEYELKVRRDLRIVAERLGFLARFDVSAAARTILSARFYSLLRLKSNF